MGVEQNNVQQQAVVANMAAVDRVTDNIKEKALQEARDTRVSRTDTITKQYLEATGKEQGNIILAGLMSKLGETFDTAKILNKFSKEDFASAGAEEDFTDTVDLKFLRSRASKGAKTGDQKGGQGEGGGEEEGTQPEVRQYLRAYTSMIVNGGNEVKKEVEKLEQKLLNEGKIKSSELVKCRSQVARSVRQEVMKQVKDAFFKQVFAQGKLEEALARHGIKKVADWAYLNDKLGGKDFGGHHQHLRGAISEAGEEAKAEARTFLQDELGRAMTRKMVGEGKEAEQAEKEISALLKVAEKCGFDTQAFVRNLPRMIDDLGMNAVISFAAGTDSSAEQGRGERRQFEYTPQEEKDILTEQLRALYMQRAVYGDWRTGLQISFKMIRTKNGLVKLGMKMEDFSRLEREGRQLAKLKLVRMLEEGFEERAAFARLAGPAWKMTEKKIKTILRNLVKLGVELDDKDIGDMRDRANERIFTEVEYEFRMIEGALEARDTPYLRQKRKTALQILKRLSEESQIPWNHDKISRIEVAT